MDLRILQTFVVAAKFENFRQTAEALFIAQPTVTQHIRLLEKELGIELFDRVGKFVKLTPAGKRFLPHATALLAGWQAGMEDLLAWQQGYSENLHIAVSPVIARSSLPGLIRHYTKRYPEVDISIRIADSLEIGRLVQSGQVDLGLSRMVPGEFQLDAHLIQTDPVVFAVPLNGGDIEAPLPDWEQELTGNLLLTHNHPGYWDDLLLALRQRGLSFRTMTVTHVDITKRFIEEGLGVSFLPRSAIGRELFENRFIELETPGLVLPQAASYLVVSKTGCSQTAKQMIEILASLYPPLPLIRSM
ncbi:LysR family transcriptional regulator [Brevibacillus massiliensis]|uniref:LysR family transcriptional regulator n=1 Tax=Brevibacillus massiliensis TaxID=1118054 RepID=UPI000474B62A